MTGTPSSSLFFKNGQTFHFSGCFLISSGTRLIMWCGCQHDDIVPLFAESFGDILKISRRNPIRTERQAVDKDSHIETVELYAFMQ